MTIEVKIVMSFVFSSNHIISEIYKKCKDFRWFATKIPALE